MSDVKIVKKVLSVALSFVLVAIPSQVLYGQGGTSAPAPQSAQQIQALVAPIALYPDALVAQVLSGSTFPDQIAIAQNWLQDHPSLTGQSLMQEVNQQSWDPSVKALMQFPSVLDNMAKNLAWTSELGEVYHNQPKDVMAAIQELRAKAQAAGALTSNSQIKVVQQSPSTIIIEPANPQIVYVPQYNPAVIYGIPYTVPGYTASDVAAASVLSFGAGVAVGALMSGGCCSWGWNSWSCGWHGGVVAYGGAPYYGNAAWHGAYGAYGYHGYGGYGAAAYHGSNGSAAAYHGPNGSAAAYHGYGADGGYHTGGAYQTAYGAGTAHTGYGPDGAVHTGGSGYNAATGQAYHYGGTSTANGGTAYHGTTSSGQHYAGGTTASGQHWGGSSSGWGHDDGWSSRAASDRGWGSMHSSGFHGGGFRRR
ncbi:MAG TPA: DUF3300 domain-containing protein [Terriglobales bacterium]|nr:DUF3300 domain-containing protein [Terriglobales bacterium]